MRSLTVKVAELAGGEPSEVNVLVPDWEVHTAPVNV